MKTPERTTAEVFPRYLGGEVLADSATLKWPGLFARRYRFPRVVDGFLVPATAEPLSTCHLNGSAEFQERPVSLANNGIQIKKNRKKLNMEIKRSGSQPSNKGPADWFAGAVRIDPLFQANTPARAAGASVTFEPGARTAWHTHPLGQTLIVTAGCGWVQREGGPIEEIHPGDVIWFPPGEKHWHGATPTIAMTHIAIQENLNGKVVEWMEKVTDDQFRK